MPDIVELIEQTGLFGEEPPVVTIDREALGTLLIAAMRKMTLEEFAGVFANPFTELMEYALLCSGENTCQRTSLLFNPHRLSTGSKRGKGSVYSALQRDKAASGLARSILFRQTYNTRTPDLLYRAIETGWDGITYINEFPPHVARDHCIRYKLSRTSKVLDPCGGWGGRMIGCSTQVNSYTAFEPSKRTYDGLKKLAQFIQGFRSEFVANVVCCAYEDAHLIEAEYDLAITSPPYFDTEIYDDAPTQSSVRYTTFDTWCEGFYYPLIERTMIQLKPGAPFLLNIGSRTYDLSGRLKSTFGGTYCIERVKNPGMTSTAGIRNGDLEGEAFYEVRKKT